MRPVAGHLVVVVLRGHSTTLWWGEDADGRDVVAAVDGHVLVWPDPAEFLEDLARRGWEPASLDEAQRLDLTPALEWHARRQRVLDPVAALNTWNLAGDVSRSVGRPWGDRGRVADSCFDKLTYANVPWLIGESAYRPRWSVTEDRYLRRRLGAAFTLFAEQFRQAPR